MPPCEPDATKQQLAPSAREGRQSTGGRVRTLNMHSLQTDCWLVWAQACAGCARGAGARTAC